MVGLEPIELAAKEALALISSNGVTLGRGALVLHDVAELVDLLQVAAALSLEGFAGNLSIIHPGTAHLQPQVGLSTAADRLRNMLRGSYLWEPGAARNLQDPLSFRCVPRSHGALYDALHYARFNLEAELNAANDNPLVLVGEGVIVSGGNFDVAGLAMAFDLSASRSRTPSRAPTSVCRNCSGTTSVAFRARWPSSRDRPTASSRWGAGARPWPPRPDHSRDR